MFMFKCKGRDHCIICLLHIQSLVLLVIIVFEFKDNQTNKIMTTVLHKSKQSILSTYQPIYPPP